MAAYVCVNDECPRHGDPKELTVELPKGESVICGGCGQPCQVGEDPPA